MRAVGGTGRKEREFEAVPALLEALAGDEAQAGGRRTTTSVEEAARVGRGLDPEDRRRSPLKLSARALT